MSLILFIMIDALGSAMLIVYFMSAVRATKLSSKSMYNLELNRMCFLIMVTNLLLGHRRATGIRKFLLCVVLIAVTILMSLGTLTGYLAMMLIVPLILIKLRIA